MLRVTASTSSAGAKQYFTENLTRSDYYLEGQEIAGHWGGRGAERLGLSGQVDQERYFALVDNLDPNTGKPLNPRVKDNRRVGYDFTFSAPKGVSVLYELSGDQRILDAFRDSVRETMTEIEREMKTRVRVKGSNEDRLTGNMVYAEFVHFTSRPVGGRPDPHLHAHVYAFNTTFDPVEERWKAGQFGDQKRDAYYYEAAFDARLAKHLNDLGYSTERRDYSFELAGVPESVIDKFSQRRNQIEAEAARLGVTSAEGKHKIGYYGREHKSIDLAKSELREEWAARLDAHERAALAAKMDGDGPKGGGGITPGEAMRHATDHAFERDSAVAEKRVKAEALRYGVGEVLPEQIERAAESASIIRHDRDGQAFVTTKEVLAEERAMLHFARDGRGRFQPFGNGRDGLEGLSAEQRAAAVHIVTSRDRVTGVRGGAGTGKTHMMRSTINAIEQGTLAPGGSHSKVFVFAPSSQASRKVLRDDEGFTNAETLERLLVDQRMQEKVKGQVIWIDEAGMVGSRDMRRAFDLAERQNARIILSGDYRQHSSVSRGDAFRLLEQEAGVKFATLEQIRRQETPWYRRAVEFISKGQGIDTIKGFERLEKEGAIIEASGEKRHKLLVADYLQAVQDDKTALVIAPTHAEGKRLAGELRNALRQHGMLGQSERTIMSRTATNWTEAERRDGRNYRPGQVVQFHQHISGERHQRNGVRETRGGFTRGESVAVVGRQGNRVEVLRESGARAWLPLDKAERFQVYNAEEMKVAKGERIRITKNGYVDDKRLNNGDIYTVVGFNRAGDLRLNNGVILPKAYGNVSYGYVDTSHASQGKTVKCVFIAVGEESLRAANRAQFYVSVSRGREAVKIYTDNAQELKEAVARSADRVSATELVKPPKASRFNLRAFAFERQRVANYLKQRAAVLGHYLQPRHDRGGPSYAR